MKKPNFLEGVLLAVCASVGGAALYTSLTLLFSITFSAHLLISAITTAYLGYLLWRSPGKTGRISAAIFCFITLFVTWLIQPSFTLFLLIHVTLISLIRVLAYCHTPLTALADFTLTSIGAAVAIWAYLNTNSLFITLWCFFLVQALFSTIPNQWNNRTRTQQETHPDRFSTAHRAAEAALHRLSNSL